MCVCVSEKESRDTEEDRLGKKEIGAEETNQKIAVTTGMIQGEKQTGNGGVCQLDFSVKTLKRELGLEFGE